MGRKHSKRNRLAMLSAEADLLLTNHGFVPVSWEGPDGAMVDIVEDARGRYGFERTPAKGSSQLGLTIETLAKIVEAEGVVPTLKRKRAITPLPKGVRKTNGGVECDAYDGPCACGAWHHAEEKSKKPPRRR